MNDIPAWKKSKVVAGAMMLIKNHVETVQVCDHCQRSIEDADGITSVTFKDKAAYYACPHCRRPSIRQMKTR
jgi:Zn finger protein HypA/HybF involved in hydrogenase expression